MTTMLFEYVAEVLVLVHGDQNPSEEEWAAYLALVHKLIQAHSPLRALLVTTFGGAPNPMQRKAVVDASRDADVPACICTDSVVARGVVTAFRWLVKAPMHAVPLDDVQTALRLLNIPLDMQPEIRAAVQRLQTQL
jgi:hypothetical protein